MSKNKLSKKTLEVQDFFDKYLILDNYVSYLSLDILRYKVSLGKSIYNLACAIKTSIIINVQEHEIPDISQVTRPYKKFFSHTLLENPNIDELRDTILEKNGVKLSRISKTRTFYIFLAEVSIKHFSSLIVDLIDLLPLTFGSRFNRSYKTLLYNYAQSNGMDTPQYSTDSISENNTEQPTIVSTCYIANQSFEGLGPTQYSSEEAAAYTARRELRVKPKQIKSSDSNFNIDNIYEAKKEYHNDNIYRVFKISKGRNLAQAFTPGHCDDALSNNERSQKGLSSIGKLYLEYLKNGIILNTTQKEVPLDFKPSLLALNDSIDDVVLSIFETNLISKLDFLFISDLNSYNSEYLANCIYSLFALGFLESTYIARKPYYSLSKKCIVTQLNDFLQSKAVARVSKDNVKDSKLKEPRFKNNNSDLNHYYKNTKSKLDSNLKIKNIRNEDLSVNRLNSTSNVLEDVKKKYQELDKSELENIWLNRSSEFNFTEEASIALSILRYNKGIDSHLLPYQYFNNQEMILELDLPSIFEVIDEPNREQEPFKPDQEPNFKVTAEKETPINSDQKKELEYSSLKTNHESFIPSIDDERSFITATVAYRVGQSNFRAKLIEKWECCNITGCRTVAALDAAHIIPYRGEKDNDIRNGLLLRADIHRLFDAYQIGIEPESLKIHVSNLVDDPMYQAYHGKKLNIGSSNQISIAALKHHWSEFVAKNNIN